MHWIVLLLILGICISSKLKKISFEEKWAENDKCFIINHLRTKNPVDFNNKLGYGFLGKNLYTQEFVFAIITAGRISENDARITIPNKNYKYQIQNIASTKFLPEINDKTFSIKMYNYNDWPKYYTNGYFFVFLSTNCENVRNEFQPTPSDKSEKVDQNLSFQLDFRKCHNICRTVYLEQEGRCSNISGEFRCTYLLPK